MIGSEPNATSGDPPAGNASRSFAVPLIVILLINAVAFVASNWFFYRQGQLDAAGEKPTIVTHEVTIPPPATIAAPVDAIAGTTVPATSDGTANPAAPSDMPAPSAVDTPNTGTVAHRSSPATKAKPATKKRSVASLAKPSQPVVVKPQNRDVALLGQPKPAYPSQAMRNHEQGTVLVFALVDVQGHVSDARVIGHSGSSALDRAATNEVRRWQFHPALRDGKPVVASVQIPVSYRLVP